MRKLITALLCFFTMSISCSAFAVLTMELTRGVAGAIPIAVVPFAATATPPQEVATVLASDLQNSGRFNVYDKQKLTVFPSEISNVSSDYFHRLGADHVVIGKVEELGNDRYQVTFQLLDMLRGKDVDKVVLKKQYTVLGRELRPLAHHISDLIYEKITGTRGVFSTKIAYVVVQRRPNAPTQYSLEVSDQDGYNPRTLLNSPEPIMSPSWSPDGKQIAYVSFERKWAGIYLHDVARGTRSLLSEFPGINGAPAWSPDGKKLALVLSRSGTPNIYVMDIASRQLKQLTNDFYINTEPGFSPDGTSLVFTSNRSGGPQIYQLKLAGGTAARLSYDGPYNARSAFTRDGGHVAMIHRVNGVYKIAILDLDSGVTRVLTGSMGDSASPSIAPNDSMVLYDTVSGGRNVLGMVSSDGRVQLLLPARNGDAQDPAWSPYLS